jgi:hypothetical protein
VPDEEVLHVGRLAAQLRVEVDADAETALREDDSRDGRGLARVREELVGVPTDLSRVVGGGWLVCTYFIQKK